MWSSHDSLLSTDLFVRICEGSWGLPATSLDLVVEELQGSVHGGFEGCDFNVLGLYVEECAVLCFVVGI